MEEEDIVDPDLFLDEESEKEFPIIPDADPFLISPMRYAINSLKGNPPQLSELAGNNHSLKVIAENLHKLLITPGDVKYNQEVRREIEYILRVFIFQVVNMSIEENRSNTESTINLAEINKSQSILKATTEKLLETTGSLDTYKKRIMDIENENKQLQNDNRELQDEYDNLFCENTKLAQKLNLTKRETDIAISKMKQANDELEDKIRSLNDTIKVHDFSRKRLENQLDQTSEELSNAQNEILALKTKLAGKTEKAESSRSEKRQLQLKMRELENENQKLSFASNELKRKLNAAKQTVSRLSPEHVIEIEKENQKLQQALSNVSHLYEMQTADVLQLTQTQQITTSILQKQANLLMEYDQCLDDVTKQKNELNHQISIIEQELDEMKKLSEKYEKNQYSSEALHQIRDMIGSDFDGKDDEIPQYLKSLIGNGDIAHLKSQNVRLMEILDGQLRFLSKIAQTGEIDLLLFSASVPKLPLTMDKSNNDKLIMEIARTRQFLSDNMLIEQELPTPDKTLLAELQENESSREIYQALSNQVTMNQILRIFCESLQTKFKDLNSLMKQLGETINFNGTIDEMPQAILDYMNHFQDFLSSAVEVIGEEVEENEQVDFVLRFIQESTEILELFDTELRRVVNFQGELRDMPEFTCNFITQYMQSSEDEHNLVVQSMRNDFDNLQKELTDVEKKSSEYINSLEIKLEEADKERVKQNESRAELSSKVNELDQKIKQLEQKVKETENRYKSSQQSCTELQDDVERLRQEKIAIQHQFDQRSLQFDQRLNKILEEERAQHKQDIRVVLKRFEEKEAKLKEEIKNQQQKNSQTKAKLKDVIQTYDAAFKKQKETVSILKAKNDELSNTLNKPKNKPTSTESQSENSRLLNTVKSLTSERKILLAKMQQLSDKCDQIQNSRDTFWASQLSLRELETRKEAMQIADEVEMNHIMFMDHIVQLLNHHVPQIEATDASVKAGMSMFVRRFEENVKNLEDLQSELIRRKDLYEERSRSSPTMKQLEEWDHWARDLFSNINDGELANQSAQELRYVLGEMIIASIGHRRLVRRLDSLRFQKKALLTLDLNVRTNPKPCMRGVLATVMASVRLMRRTGNFSSLFSDQLTPTKGSVYEI